MSYPQKLVLVCIECGEVAHAPLLGENMRIAPRHLYLQCKFILSVISPPGTGEVVMAPCCEPCALKVHGPLLLKKAIESVLGGN